MGDNCTYETFIRRTKRRHVNITWKQIKAFDRFDSTKSINTTIGIKIFQYVSFRIWIGRVDQTWRISASYLFTLSSLFGMNGLWQSWNDPAASRVISPGACRLEDISSPPLVCPNLLEVEGVVASPSRRGDNWTIYITLRIHNLMHCFLFFLWDHTTVSLRESLLEYLGHLWVTCFKHNRAYPHPQMTLFVPNSYEILNGSPVYFMVKKTYSCNIWLPFLWEFVNLLSRYGDAGTLFLGGKHSEKKKMKSWDIW